MNLSTSLRKLQMEHVRLGSAAAIVLSLILFTVEALHHPIDSEGGRIVRLLVTIGRDMGIAVLISVIVGWAIEWMHRQRLLEDVFKASVGYILPEELKDEVRALYEARFVCVEHVQESQLLPIDEHPNLVCLKTRVRRTFKNATSSKQDLESRVSVTEWFNHPALRSRVLGMGAVLSDGCQITKFHCGRETQGGKMNKIYGVLDETITLDLDKTCTCWHETIETKRVTDVANFVFEYPTRNPHATLEPQLPNMIGIVRFNSRHRGDVDKIGTTMRMNGTLVPYQGIELRWFPNQDYEAWAKTEVSCEPDSVISPQEQAT